MSNLKSKSNFYYLLPAFGSIIGGLIAMIILRKQGRQYDKLGRNCVVLGLLHLDLLLVWIMLIAHMMFP